MKRYQPAPGLSIPCVAMGCMRIAGMEVSALETLVKTALEGGVDYFDHADFYGDHQSEVRFGEMLKANPSLRDRMLIQSKCGIRTGFYDSSYEHIVHSAENSLRKLHTDHLMRCSSTVPTCWPSRRRLPAPSATSRKRARCATLA